jgi:formate dehydrogenase accessory protein FdhD
MGADRPPSLGASPGLGYGAVSSRQSLTQLAGAVVSDAAAEIAEEVPVAFVYGARSHAVMMATPADLEDLAVGFTLSEGIAQRSEIGEVRVARHSRGIELTIDVPLAVAERLATRTRAIAGRTGCGLCGVDAIDEAVRTPVAVERSMRVRPTALYTAGEALKAHQPLNAATHAVHAAAWATPDGVLRVVREDVGRHNALDKVLGALWRAGTDPATGFVVITSRASFELVQKTTAAGVQLLAAVSRPTGLAVRLADTAGLTLVTVLRGESAHVHTHPERLSA